jgi:predicted TPR repeat methyltransferase
VEEEISRLLGQPAATFDVLDAGCGTGLCADFLRLRARHLVGVDLSTKMIEQARSRSLYDALVVDELTNYLQRHASAFDLIVSADTLVYFGDLTDVLDASAKALRSGGTIVFTIERTSEASCPAGFRLSPHGRYGHTSDYVSGVLAGARFIDALFQAVELRKEAGAWVQGWLVSAKVD